MHRYLQRFRDLELNDPCHGVDDIDVIDVDFEDDRRRSSVLHMDPALPDMADKVCVCV